MRGAVADILANKMLRARMRLASRISLLFVSMSSAVLKAARTIIERGLLGQLLD